MEPKKNRRTFLRSLPLIPAAGIAVAQDAPSPNAAQIDALADTVRLRYGQYLVAGDMEEIKRGIERMQRSAEAILKVKVTNSDEPDFSFHPADSSIQ
jgi:hypothetical protein